MASAFSSDVKITSNQQPKRLALDGGEYTYNEFKSHNRENLGEEKWKQVTELLISNLKVASQEEANFLHWLHLSWTTFRRMAQDTVNKIISLGKLPKKECKTERESECAR